MHISKFLIIGALSLGFTSNALATSEQIQADIQNVQKDNIAKMIQEVHDIIDIQYQKGFLSEKSNMTVSINPSADTMLKNMLKKKFLSTSDSTQETTKDFNIAPSFAKTNNNKEAANRATRIDGVCQVSVAFDDDGSSSRLTVGEGMDILSVTTLTNETQKRMAREFLALHENFHCEFASIENPVIVPGQSLEFNQEISYLLKDQSLSRNMQRVPYITLLNENYADTSAVFALMKQYGTKNKDLLHVINTITTQRHSSYFQFYIEEHATHFSLEKALTPNILKELSSVNDNASFKALALKVANEGTQEVISHKPILITNMISVANIDSSVRSKITSLIRYQFLSDKVKESSSLNLWRDNINRGFAFELAKNIVGKRDFTSLKLYTEDGEAGEDYYKLNSIISELLQNSKMTSKQIISYSNAERNLAKFQAALIQPVPTNDFNFVQSSLSNETVRDKMSILRDDFIQKRTKIGYK